MAGEKSLKPFTGSWSTFGPAGTADMANRCEAGRVLGFRGHPRQLRSEAWNAILRQLKQTFLEDHRSLGYLTSSRADLLGAACREGLPCDIGLLCRLSGISRPGAHGLRGIGPGKKTPWECERG